MVITVASHSDGKTRESSEEIDHLPDTCSLCHKSGEIKFLQGYVNYDSRLEPSVLELVVQCPRNECKRLGIAYYGPLNTNYSKFRYLWTKPAKAEAPELNSDVANISPDFEEIFSQAHEAEKSNLDKIAGVGYRKALEFLIKDYLIDSAVSDEVKLQIKEQSLGTCIEKHVTDQRIKDISKRAVWLGNDETHYQRKWDDKDINDLKMLIELCVYWIGSEILTKQILEKMPTPKHSS